MRASSVKRRWGLPAALALAAGLVVLGAPAGQAGAAFDVSVAKTDSPDPAGPGTQVTYTINLSVTGTSVLSTVNDVLPAQTTFVSVTAPALWTCITPAVGSGGTVSCTGSLVAGTPVAITLVVRVVPGVPDGTTIANTASVPVGGGLGDTDSSNNSATATTTVRAAAPTAPPAGAGAGTVDALPAVPVTGIPSFTG